MNKKNIIISLVIISVLLLISFFAIEANAATLMNPLKVNSVQEVIYLAVDLAVYVGTAFAILALIYVGFKFVAAQGNEEKLKEAKRWFLYIVIGLAILISAKVIVTIVKNTLVDAGVVDSKVFKP